MSLADALEIGVAFHKQGWLKPAEEVYRAVLKLQPEEPNALHYLGMLHHQAGDSEAGVALIRAAIERRPDWFDAHNNLGNVLKESGSLADAAAAYRRALELAPEDAAIRERLAEAQSALQTRSGGSPP